MKIDNLKNKSKEDLKLSKKILETLLSLDDKDRIKEKLREVNYQLMERNKKIIEASQECDAETYKYFLSVLPPIYYEDGIFQVSEAVCRNDKGFLVYATYKCVGDPFSSDAKYYFMGNMTIKQADEI